MDLDTISRFISTVGFPVAVAGWLLFKTNGKLDRLADALKENTVATREFISAFEERRRRRQSPPTRRGPGGPRTAR